MNILNHFRRVVSGLLSLTLTGSLCMPWLPAAAAASHDVSARQVSQATGSIALTVRFALPQRADEVAGRNLTLQLTNSSQETASITLEDGSVSGSGITAGQISVAKQNTQGVALTTEQQIGYYQVSLNSLPLGTYTLTLTGDGYTTCTTQVELQDYSQHVIMSTGDGTFSLGDVDGSDLVDGADLMALEEQLGQSGELATYDLNGDNLVDIVDLSYLNKVMDLTGTPRILDTAAIVSAQVEEGVLSVTEGTLEDLFTGESAVTVAPAEGQEELSIPIVLDKPTEMSEISITTPSADGAIQEGTVVVETKDGQTMEIPFSAAAPEGVHAISRLADQNVVTINLGNKIPVKKVTIKVTKVEGQAGEKPEYATVSQIEFLKDIVSDEMKADTQVKGVAATAGDGEVSLVWDSMPNVTGYTVRYGQNKDSLTQSVAVSSNQATISGLENNKTYYFQVTATNGDWSGTASAILAAMPVPASVPGAPSNIVVEAADGALRVSWGKTKDATYYQLFYRQKGEDAFQQFGGNMAATSGAITGLVNGTEYEVAVKAGNLHGVGPYSAAALGTPKRESFQMPELPTQGRIDNEEVTSIVMADPGNVNKSLCPNFNVNTDLTDNDPNTYWIANTYWSNSSITYTFGTTHDMNYLLLVPYLDAAYKNRIANYTVTLKGEDGQTLATYYRDGANINSSNYYIIAFPETKGVKSVTLALGEKTGGPRVSISEIAFYNSDTLADEIAALFSDGSFTKLRSGVEQEEITALKERLSAMSSFYLDVAQLRDELNLAQALLEQQEDALGLVKNDFQSRSTGAAADKAAGQTASDLQPLGITAKAGATLAIYAQLPDDATVYVVPTQFYGESGVWKGTPIALKNGRNYITVEQIGSLSDPRGGPLYLTYAGSHPEQIKLQVRGSSNVFTMPVLELSNWYSLGQEEQKAAIRAYVQELNAYVTALSESGVAGESWKITIRNATEISTPSVLLSIPADQALSGLKGVNNDEDAMVEVLYQNILAWEEELFVANKVQGILDSDTALEGYRYPMTTRQNIRYMRMFAGAFMYAAGNHVGVEYGSTAALVQGKPTSATGTGHENGLFGWGIAHEIGHNMDKLGKAETTNNIYSLFLQAWDGGSMTVDTRLTADQRWTDIFNKVAQGRPGAANNVFVQLGMYWQLHLAYDEADAPMAFYNAFFKAWKANEYSGYSYDERVALIASKVADRDLTAFFTRWGMTLSDEVKAILDDYTPETRAIWYLNDASRTYRLQSGAANSGATTVSAQVSDQTVTLTMESTDSAHILGYEIRRNGVAIGFTTGNTYEDNLGAANNLTYTYSVVPVDKLGNQGSEASAAEVRVAYDKTISADLYTVERSGETVTITMKHGAAVPVTGLKVTDSGEMSGAYTVTATVQVTNEQEETEARTVTAKTGTLSGTELVGYFTKPGAGPEDTRIWTYTVTALTITGIPETADVALLDYPGDRVDFYEGATVGILKDAYGDIPAGTLVILGTYRGDPVYNYAQIEARYNTTPEAGEVTTITRAMNGELYMLAEIPADGAVSDTSDGFFIFVPNMEEEELLNKQDGVTDRYPIEIRAVFYRTDEPGSTDSQRVTSQTLWISFPDGGDEENEVSLPYIELKNN